MQQAVEAEPAGASRRRTHLRLARTVLRTPRYWLTAFGVDPLRFMHAMRGLPRVIVDYVRFRRLHKDAEHWPVSLSAPCPGDRTAPSGEVRGHYFWQDLHVAQRIFNASPAHHIDVGSRVDGFVAHVAAFRPLTVLDIRPTYIKVANITFIQCDLLALPPNIAATADSVSCLHALEHFGLGRYGDALGDNLYEKGLECLIDLLTPGGTLYLSVPIGRQRVEFNAHRVFAVPTVLDMARPALELTGFSYVDDYGGFHPNADPLAADYARLVYGCGIFEFRKR
jgi:SAM-dependent methyltransferase